MIPLRDNIPHYRKPIVTVTLLIVNVVIFLYEVSLGQGVGDFIYTLGFVPRTIFSSVGFVPKFMPLFTNMFLHASWPHLIGNMLFLWIFADNVEDKLGHVRFLLFYLLCGIAASGVHFIMNINSSIPAVGASGAIAGVLGAYMLLFPSARVLTLIPFFIFWQIVEVPAFVFLGIWFLYQFMLGMVTIGSQGAGIAFWAHIGGFVAGIVLLKVLRKRRYYYSF